MRERERREMNDYYLYTHSKASQMRASLFTPPAKIALHVAKKNFPHANVTSAKGINVCAGPCLFLPYLNEDEIRERE